MRFWTNLVISIAVFGLGAIYFLKPTAFNNSPIKLPFSRAAQSSPTWLIATRLIGAVLMAVAIYGLVALFRHQTKL